MQGPCRHRQRGRAFPVRIMKTNNTLLASPRHVTFSVCLYKQLDRQSSKISPAAPVLLLFHFVLIVKAKFRSSYVVIAGHPGVNE